MMNLIIFRQDELILRTEGFRNSVLSLLWFVILANSQSTCCKLIHTPKQPHKLTISLETVTGITLKLPLSWAP